MVICRPPGSFGLKQSLFAFYTDPFLVGLGCGICGSLSLITDTARRAIEKGYEIELSRVMRIRRGEMPLAAEELSVLQNEFRGHLIPLNHS